MAEFHVQGRYGVLTDDLFKITDRTPNGMYDFVKLYKAEFTRRTLQIP